MRPYRKRMQIIFQDPFGSLNPRMPVSDIIGEGLMAQGMNDSKVRTKKIEDALEAVGLRKSYTRRYPHEFSGGQRQRIGIARALALDPEFIVCDEPVSALDVSIQSQILNLLLDLRSQYDLTYLFISHNLSVVEYFSDRVGVMYLGQIQELATVDQLYRGARHPYTVALLSAIPRADPRVRRRRLVLKGDLPSPAAPPDGCRFHTRCWLREKLGNPENCSTVDPPLRDLGEGHMVKCHYAEQVTIRRGAGGRHGPVAHAHGGSRRGVTSGLRRLPRRRRGGAAPTVVRGGPGLRPSRVAGAGLGLVLLLAACSSATPAAGAASQPGPGRQPGSGRNAQPRVRPRLLALAPASGAPSSPDFSLPPGVAVWPTDIIDATIALGALDNQIKLAGADLAAGVSEKDVDRILGATDGLADLMTQALPNAQKLTTWADTKEAGTAYVPVLTAIGTSATAGQRGASGRRHRDVRGRRCEQLSAAMEQYGTVRGPMVDLVDQALLMRHMLVK